MNLFVEDICGFKVTETRKKIWAKELEMLNEFHKVCVKNNLTYFLSDGTLLGAVRHNGFIPWDDDVDVVMKREDYEKFLEIFNDNFDTNKYFLQHSKSELLYPNGHAQIRNNYTTQFTTQDFPNLKMGKNLGIFIDIFPLDKALSSNDSNQIKIKKYKQLCFAYLNPLSTSKLKTILKKIYLTIFCNSGTKCKKLIDKIDVLSKEHNRDLDAKIIGEISFAPTLESTLFPVEWFDKVELHKFEDYEFYIPSSYDKILKKQFGNYLEYPKDINNSNCHGSCFFDFDNSYSKYKDLSKNEFMELINNFKY